MKTGYGQFCPLAKAAELLCERWTMLVVRELIAGSRHFNDLRRGLPLMSPTLLSSRLKQLIQQGVVQRAPDEHGAQAYMLTQAGQELRSLVELMGIWGHRWIGSQFQDQDLDVGLLMWDIRRGVKADCFPMHRVVLEIHFFDAPKGMQQWWLVSEEGEVDLCLEDPGQEPDLLIRCSTRALTSVWMHRQSLAEAQRTGEVKIMGAESLKRLVPMWLQGSPLARMGAESLAKNPIS